MSHDARRTPLRWSWDTLDAMVSGRSAIDLPQLNIATVAEAEAFLEAYGFELADPVHAAEVAAIRSEAVAFLEEEVLAGEPGLAIPPEVRDEADVARLICMASDDADSDRRRWACALLRVAHAFAHARSPVADQFGPEIEARILGRFRAHVREDAGGAWLGVGDEAIPLARFEARVAKPKRSVVMKLLHKAENVATDVFDRVGVRFVTRERLDCLLVVRFLRRKNVMMFANVKPSRSRNSLIDLRWLRGEVERLGPAADLDTLRALVRERPLPDSDPARQADNPFSSLEYRAIQLTGRQLLRIGGLHFFFPFEVQVLDEAAYEQARQGLAAHDIYKDRQRAAVRRRVLGPLLPGAGAGA